VVTLLNNEAKQIAPMGLKKNFCCYCYKQIAPTEQNKNGKYKHSSVGTDCLKNKN